MSITIKTNGSVRTLYNVKEVPLLPEFAWLTESGLRHMIFQSQPRKASNGEVIPGNGMLEAGVVKRLGKRVLIDIEKLRAWVNGDCPKQTMTMEIK